jgi:hypothetical protein
MAQITRPRRHILLGASLAPLIAAVLALPAAAQTTPPVAANGLPTTTETADPAAPDQMTAPATLQTDQAAETPRAA